MKNLINFFEIPTSDYDRGVKFYSNLLGIELQKNDYGSEKMAFFPETDFNVRGAIVYAEGYKPSDQGTILSFNTDGKMDEILSDLEKIGGKLILPKTKIDCENQGHCAVILDSEGNKIGLHEY